MGSILISAGCSFTDHNYYDIAFKEDTPNNHLFWDELMAEELGLVLHSYGRSGAGGDRHLFDITQAVAKYGSDIEAIVIGWSIWDRFTYPYSSGVQQVCPPTIHVQPFPGHEYSSFVNVQKHSAMNLFKSCLLSTFAQMYTISKLADSISAKLLVFQMMAPINTHLKNTERRNMIDDAGPSQYEILYQTTEENPTYKILEQDKRFSGFPYLKRLGGEHVWNIDRKSGTFLKSQGNNKMFFPLKELRINREITKVKWVRYDDLGHKKVMQKWDDEKIVGDEFLKNETKAFNSLEGQKLTITDTHPNHNGQRFIFERVIDRWNELYK